MHKTGNIFEYMTKKGNINELIFDDKNFNKGSEYGNALLDKSISKFGAGRSVLVDKNNRIIAGNKTAEKFGELGNQNIIIVETTGSELVVVKRTDIDLDSNQGRELALADNQVAKINFVLAEEVLAETLSVEVCESWGVKDFKVLEDEPSYDDLLGEERNKQATLKITFKTVEQLQKAEIDITELIDRKYKGAYFSVSAGEI